MTHSNVIYFVNKDNKGIGEMLLVDLTQDKTSKKWKATINEEESVAVPYYARTVIAGLIHNNRRDLEKSVTAIVAYHEDGNDTGGEITVDLKQFYK